ncbi:SLATT domain-containing protein [Lactobacillus sp. LC28-10]|uniref:SLATT domain-containing protein n=1 Tax=Secundilactobacillus angelensis TaxID=2722706 RepID=A0ABX1L0X3_9LACO|nr:SLATT domain-containing protein [Secundilactobacillus angelensis]MCH5462741.1 SLATT domain-containing protein [Secundilactobacillus angelensis]NLR19105.1 SLATT domain-containing protein [Secundilactobacillus angelensis]
MDDKMVRFNLESQIREAFGRVQYTYTTHLKQVDRLRKRQACVKWLKIILSAISTSGILGTILINSLILKLLSALISAGLTGATLYFKDFDVSEEITSHSKTANDLWQIREDYVSLLTDSPSLQVTDIRQKRDEFTERTKDIYDTSMKTDPKSYQLAQQSLKYGEEQHFTTLEIDKMLPEHLRRSQITVKNGTVKTSISYSYQRQILDTFVVGLFTLLAVILGALSGSVIIEMVTKIASPWYFWIIVTTGTVLLIVFLYLWNKAMLIIASKLSEHGLFGGTIQNNNPVLQYQRAETDCLTLLTVNLKVIAGCAIMLLFLSYSGVNNSFENWEQFTALSLSIILIDMSIVDLYHWKKTVGKGK